MRTALHWSNNQGHAEIHGDPILKGFSGHRCHSTDIVIAPFPITVPGHDWDADLYMAVLLQALGVPLVAPESYMPDPMFNAMAFAQAQDFNLVQFVGTPEYQAGSHFIFHF